VLMGLRKTTVRERRQQPRNDVEIDAPAFIEIRHTYGPVRKSVYKVVEYNEGGTSFLVPVADGYFRSGYPLEYALVTPDLTKMDRFGVVRYYHPFNDDQGGAFFRVGVENQPRRHKKNETLRIRPDRYDLSAKREQFIYFAHGDQEFQFPLVDISRYSAAFFSCEDQALGLSVSAALRGVEIVYGSRTVFQGTVIVTRCETLTGENRYRIVVEPRDAVFNVEMIETEDTLSTVSRSVEHLLVAAKKHRRIDQRFKSLVSDMRLFLEEYRRILDMPAAATLSMVENEAFFLDDLSNTFYPEMNRYVEEFDEIVSDLALSEAEHGLYKSYFQSNFHPLLMSAPFCHRTYFKPLGYPGDFEMMRMIKEAAFKGPTLFFKLIHHAMIASPMSVANRNRIRYLADKITEVVEASDAEQVNLLSIASGPAFEIQRIIEERPEIGNRIHVTLLDQEIEALRFSQDNIYMKRILHNCHIQVSLIHERIGTFLKNVARGKTTLPKLDMVYIFGLFDYFDDRTCRFCIDKSATLLNPNARILVSNYSLEGHRHRAFIEYALEWYMVYRNAEEMMAIGRNLARPFHAAVSAEPSGIIKFLELTSETNSD
jgi:extracellular factor (EF) 3-hydroxypalmitic acid methyl ester biosynthesis protein